MCLLGKAQSPSAASLSLEHTLLDCGKNDLTKTLQCHYTDEGTYPRSGESQSLHSACAYLECALVCKWNVNSVNNDTGKGCLSEPTSSH